MEKQLIIIGNGFDLQCGLKSSYSDFYVSEVKNRFSKLNSYEFDIEPKNFWYTLLCYHDNHINYRWCDIERIIKDTMYLIAHTTDNLETNNYVALFDYAWNQIVDAIKNHTAPDFIVEPTLKPLTEFIVYYCYNYLTFYYYDKIRKNIKSLTTIWEQAKAAFNEHLLLELNCLEKGFCEYLKLRANYTTDYRINATNLLIKLSELKLKPIRALNSFNLKEEYNISSINFLSFNYTMPFSHITPKKMATYNNVHGTLCKSECTSCNTSTVIFGIDDKVVGENSDLRLFSKTYRTLFLDRKSTILPKCDENEKLNIKFYGHSLNEADYSYFQSIFDYYNIYINNNVTLTFYYSDFACDAKNKTIDAVYNLINQYGLTLNNKDQGKNLMHKLILEQRVKIKELS